MTQTENPQKTDPAFYKQLQDYRLTTAEIIYRLPDYPLILQSYIWQDYDIAPRFPVLHKFLHFWEQKLDGPLYGVKVTAAGLITPTQFSFADAEYKIH